MAFLKLNRMGSSKIFSTIFLLECSFLLLESIFKDFQKRSIQLSCFLETNKIKCLWKVDIFVCGLKSIFENKYSFISYLKVTFFYLSLVLSLSLSFSLLSLIPNSYSLSFIPYPWSVIPNIISQFSKNSPKIMLVQKDYIFRNLVKKK